MIRTVFYMIFLSLIIIFVSSLLPGLVFLMVISLAAPWNVLLAGFSLIIFFFISSTTALFLSSILLRIFSFRNDDFEPYELHLALKEICAALMRLTSSFVQGSFRAFFYKLQGANIGPGVEIWGELLDVDLISIGANSVVGTGAVISAHMNNLGIFYSPVRIGRNCLIGAFSLICPGVRIGNNVKIGANTVVARNKRISSNSVYTNKGFIK